MYPMRCDNVQLLICEDEFGTKSYYAVNACGWYKASAPS